MGVLGGLDVGFGANMQIVRTNYLVVNTVDAGSTAEMARFLALYNTMQAQNAAGHSGLTCDYILSESHAPGDAATAGVDDPTVITGIDGAALPIAGQHSRQTGQNVIAVLAVGATLLNKAGTSAGAVASALDANADRANSDLLHALAGVTDVDATFADNVKYGALQTVNLSGMVADIKAAMGGNDADLSGETLLSATGFVEKGNATGAAPATFAGITDVANSSIAVLTCVTLMGTGFA